MLGKVVKSFLATSFNVHRNCTVAGKTRSQFFCSPLHDIWRLGVAINLDQDRKFKRVLTIGPNPRRREKIKLNFYLHTSLWCLERFYEGLKSYHKTFWGTTKKCENENLIEFLFKFNFQKGTGREGLRWKYSHDSRG